MRILFCRQAIQRLILIDYQPHIMMGVRNIDHDELINNTKALIRSAVHFDVPVIFSHVGVGLNGSQPFLEELRELAPNAIVIDRTNVNAWEEPEFVAAVEATGRKKLIMGGLWTDVCLAYPAIEASQSGFEVYVPEDTIGSITDMSHANGMRRMIQAGVVPITWNVVLAELQRDHARTNTGRRNISNLPRVPIQNGSRQGMEVSHTPGEYNHETLFSTRHLCPRPFT